MLFIGNLKILHSEVIEKRITKCIKKRWSIYIRIIMRIIGKINLKEKVICFIKRIFTIPIDYFITVKIVSLTVVE